jgi:hypothetical protein
LLALLIQVLETPSFQRQGPLLPPGFNQVQPASVFGNELQLLTRPGSEGPLGLFADPDDTITILVWRIEQLL